MRDFTVNEITHYLLGYDTCVASHKFININLFNLSKKMFKSHEVGFQVKEG